MYVNIYFFIKGTFNGWQKLRMSRSHKDFVAMIELGEGDHEYKFLVDGQWITDSGAPTVENNSGKEGTYHIPNILNYKKFNHRLIAENGIWMKFLAYSIIFNQNSLYPKIQDSKTK